MRCASVRVRSLNRDVQTDNITALVDIGEQARTSDAVYKELTANGLHTHEMSVGPTSYISVL